jgi:flagellar biosynthesis chaperone FliJ
MKKIVVFFALTGLLTSCSLDVPPEITREYASLPEVIDFNYHVQPILSDRCYQCHGPDEKTRKADLRLDVEAIAFSKLESGKRAFSPGNLYKSESAYRIIHQDPEILMPPPESNLSLTNREKAIIFKWIEQGAQWKKHWAFLPPKKQNPKSTNDTELSNPIDLFIKEKLDREGLDFSPKAPKSVLARRAYLDLTGLPPSTEELDAFLDDNSEKAFENLVDRLLQTDAHAERLALDWMDLSRYADSHGLHADGARTMWPWRDWVLKAFKQNMPYDQFVTWQLAGDLLPNATQEQKLATAFNRNSPMTAEGGVIDEEWRLHYVFDRTETLSTAFLGLTMACAKCHDHKFDPISQKDYYQLTAFFNNIRELGMTGDDGDYGPLLPLTDPLTQKKLDQLNQKMSAIKKDLEITQKQLEDIYQYSEQLVQNTAKTPPTFHAPFEKIADIPKNRHSVDGQKEFYGGADQKPKIVQGIKGNAFEFSQDYDHLHITNKLIPNLEWTDPFSISMWINTNKRKKESSQTLIANSGGKNELWRGWEYYLDDQNRINLRLINVSPSNLIHVRSVDSIPIHQWQSLTLTVDGSGKADGVKMYRNGKTIEKVSVIDNLYKSMLPTRRDREKGFVNSERNLVVGRSYEGSTGDYGLFSGQLDELQFFEGVLTPFEVQSIHEETLGKETPKNWPLLQQHLIDKDPKIVKLKKQLQENRKEYLETYTPVQEIMVMREMKTPRPTYLYNRGNYNEPLYTVEAKVPEILPAMNQKLPKNRLGLSQWLFDPKNPLTARVTVNRYWQMIFGQGLVATPNDFGVQGQLPSHPELLDWLAASFSEDWDLRALIKKMVLSKTYQQQSKSDEIRDQKDPNNLLLARANATRLPAEIIRDNALKISGLLNPKTGGESVRPYQPKGLWKEKNNFSTFLLEFEESEGEDLYRRGLYTFIRRTSPPPNMLTFDATSREVCTVKRDITSTPLQALVLMNDPQFFEASRVFAERMINSRDQLEEQIGYGFRLATARYPKKEELDILVDLYKNQYQFFRQNQNKAYQLLSVGKKPRDTNIYSVKTAAMTMVANTILNHNETYTKR